MLVSRLFRVQEVVLSIGFSHDGQQLAIGLWDGTILIWDLMNGKQTEVWKPWTPMGVSAITFAEDGKRLVFGLHDCGVWVWDLEKAEAVGGGPFIGHEDPVWAVSFLDQEHIVSRSGFRTVRVWNMNTREGITRMDVATGTIHSAIHYTKLFANDCRTKSGFEVCSWSEAMEGKEKHKAWVIWRPAAAFSPDGKLVATCSSTHVYVWFATGCMAGSLAGGPFRNKGGMCLAFSADGRRIVSGTNETLHVWKVRRCLYQLANNVTFFTSTHWLH